MPNLVELRRRMGLLRMQKVTPNTAVAANTAKMFFSLLVPLTKKHKNYLIFSESYNKIHSTYTIHLYIFNRVSMFPLVIYIYDLYMYSIKFCYIHLLKYIEKTFV